MQKYEDYFITSCGRVWSFKRNKFLKPGINHKGYKYVILTIDGKRVPKTVHRLVAETYISNPNNLPQVNHKDENKLNNALTNLEWCTNQYNAAYSFNKRIVNLDTGRVYESLNQAADCSGISRQAIHYSMTTPSYNGKLHFQYL